MRGIEKSLTFRVTKWSDGDWKNAIKNAAKEFLEYDQMRYVGQEKQRISSENFYLEKHLFTDSQVEEMIVYARSSSGIEYAIHCNPEDNMRVKIQPQFLSNVFCGFEWHGTLSISTLLDYMPYSMEEIHEACLQGMQNMTQTLQKQNTPE